MNAPVTSRFAWGQQVVVGIDLLNGGSHPDRSVDVLLVAHGTRGAVGQVGLHVDTHTPVYLVEFEGDCVVGCLEQEIALEQPT